MIGGKFKKRKIWNFSVVGQPYEVNVVDEYVLLGNSALLRCLIPSFVTDFVQVDQWIGQDATIHAHDRTNGTLGY